MEIDLWTLIAQVINLFILLFLLRKFLYIPVLKAVDARRELIRNELQKAHDERIMAQKFRDSFSKKFAEIDQEKQKILLQTQINAEQLEQKLIAKAQEEYLEICRKWQQKLIKQKDMFQQQIHEIIVDCFNKTITNALSQIADENLNDLAVQKFIQKMMQLNEQEKQKIIKNFSKTIEVQSAKELPDITKKELKRSLQQIFALSDNIDIKYSIDADLICGIAVMTKEYSISWSLAEYLEIFKNKTDEAIQKLIERG